MDYDAAAERILDRAASKPVKAPSEPRPGPDPIVAGSDDTLADAYAKGFEAAARAAGECCGCNVYNSRHAGNIA